LIAQASGETQIADYCLAQHATATGQLKVAYEAFCMTFQQSGDSPELRKGALDAPVLEPFWLDIQDVS
jgi:hypothetical protein